MYWVRIVIKSENSSKMIIGIENRANVLCKKFN